MFKLICNTIDLKSKIELIPYIKLTYLNGKLIGSGSNSFCKKILVLPIAVPYSLELEIKLQVMLEGVNLSDVTIIRGNKLEMFHLRSNDIIEVKTRGFIPYSRVDYEEGEIQKTSLLLSPVLSKTEYDFICSNLPDIKATQLFSLFSDTLPFEENGIMQYVHLLKEDFVLNHVIFSKM